MSVMRVLIDDKEIVSAEADDVVDGALDNEVTIDLTPIQNKTHILQIETILWVLKDILENCTKKPAPITIRIHKHENKA